MDVRRSGLPNPSAELKTAEHLARELADRAGKGLPSRWGFAILFFNYDGQEMSWISSANREDMIKALREIADKLEVDAAGGPVAPFSQ